MQIPEKITITKRLFNDIQILYSLTKEKGKESGGLLILGAHGHMGVVSLMEGQEREIILEPEEELFESERYLGSLHVHPITSLPSTGDVISFLEDEYELVMIVIGEDTTINMCIKTPKTKLGEFPEIDERGQEEIKEIASEYGFLFYTGKDLTLKLENKIEGYDVVSETWEVEKLLSALGLEGLEMFPEEYSTKKD